MGGHREYIDHVLKTGTIPQVRQGWEMYQPPFYYYLVALWVEARKQLMSLDRFRMVQLLSAALYLVTVCGAIILSPVSVDSPFPFVVFVFFCFFTKGKRRERRRKPELDYASCTWSKPVSD